MFIGTGNVNLSRGTLTRGAVSRGGFNETARGGASFGAPVSQNNGRGGFASNGQQGSIFDNPTNSFSRGAPSRGGLSRGAFRGNFSRGMSDGTSFNNPPSRGSFSPSASRGMSSEKSFNNNPFCQTRGDSFSARGGSTSRGQDNTRGDFRRGSFGIGFNAPALDQSNESMFDRSNRGGFNRAGSGGNSVPLGRQRSVHFADEESQEQNRPVTNAPVQPKHVQAEKQPITNGLVQREPENVPLAVLPVSEEDKLVFGEEIEKKFVGHELPRSRAERDFVPKVRSADGIFQDDEKHAKDYDKCTDEDDPLVIEGLAETPEIFETWDEIGIHRQLRKNVKRSQYNRPRKIQLAAIPLILKGHDLQVTAETGIGKTAAYLVPIIEKCYRDKRDGTYVSIPCNPYAVVLCPTRELVMQCYEQSIKFTDGIGITTAKAYGEYQIHKNKEELVGTCDIVFATPGRFCDFLQRRWIVLSRVKFLVFDEGDQLLGNSDFTKVLDSAVLYSEPKIPLDHQTIFISATFNASAKDNIRRYMRPDKIVYIRNKVTVPPRKCEQVFNAVDKMGKFGVILTFLRNEFKKYDKEPPKTIVFCNQSLVCEKLAVALETSGIHATPLSGMLGQDLREEALNGFRGTDSSVLCVTNLGAHGIDIKDVDLVINYDMPRDFETYVHRAGRAARIRQGKCVSFVSVEYDKPVLYKIKKAMEEAGHVIPPSLTDVLGDYDPEHLTGFGFKNINAGSIFGSAKKQDVVKVDQEKPQVSVRSTDNLVKEDKKANDVEKAVVPSALTKAELTKDESALKAPIKKAEEPVASLQKNDERKPKAAPISTPANVVAPQNVGPEVAALFSRLIMALGFPTAQVDAAVAVPSASVAEPVADEKVAATTENRLEGIPAPVAVKEANTADPSIGSKKSSGSQSDKKSDPNKEHKKKSRSTGKKDAGKEKKKAAARPPPPVSPEEDDVEDEW